MRFVLVLSLVALPVLAEGVLSISSAAEGVRLDAKNPGCDPEIHVCSDNI